MKICNKIMHYKNNITINETDSQQIKNIKTTKNFLRNNPNLYILKADKCYKTVIMTKMITKTKYTN